MANPNIVQTSTIKGRTDVTWVISTSTILTGNAAASGKVYKVNTLLLSNTDPSGNVDVDLVLERGASTYAIAIGVNVTANSTVVARDKNTPIYLLEGDSILVKCATSDTSAEALCSYEEIS